MAVNENQRNTWLFSGVSSGLGKEWALFLLGRGDRVIGITRDASSVAQIRSRYKNQFIPVESDITDMDILEAKVDSALKRNSIHSVTHVVCSAAYAHFGTIEDVSPAALEESFRVNVVGSRNVAITGLKRMTKSGDRRIIFISSMAGLHCWPNLGSYQISKFAVRALSDTLREELAQQGIQVGCLYPGPHTGTGWAEGYAMHTDPSDRYDAGWLAENCRCGFTLAEAKESLSSFKQIISIDPMPAAITTHAEVAKMFKEDAVETSYQLDRVKE